MAGKFSGLNNRNVRRGKARANKRAARGNRCGCANCLKPAHDLIGIPVEPRNKTGRNDPCPCGTGRKFKRCCA